VPPVSRIKAATGCKPVDIVAVAMAIRAMADDSRERQMAAMKSQRTMVRRMGDWDAGPWQENAIRIMEDRGS